MWRLALIVLLVAQVFAAKKPDPSEFTTQATIIDVTSHREASFRSANGTGRTRYNTIFTMTTEIGAKVYDLQGPRLDTGKYSVKIKGGKIGFLTTDKKGNPKEIDCEIVGEHQKD